MSLDKSGERTQICHARENRRGTSGRVRAKGTARARLKLARDDEARARDGAPGRGWWATTSPRVNTEAPRRFTTPRSLFNLSATFWHAARSNVLRPACRVTTTRATRRPRRRDASCLPPLMAAARPPPPPPPPRDRNRPRSRRETANTFSRGVERNFDVVRPDVVSR